MGILHEPHVTGGGAASVKQPEFQAVNTVLGNLKTALTGTYHAFDFAKYAHRYLGEVQYRFNRRFDLRAILGRLARAAFRPRRARFAQFVRLNFLADQVVAREVDLRQQSSSYRWCDERIESDVLVACDHGLKFIHIRGKQLLCGGTVRSEVVDAVPVKVGMRTST